MSESKLRDATPTLVLTTGRWIGRRSLSLTAHALAKEDRTGRREIPLASFETVRLERTRNRFGPDALRVVIEGAAGGVCIDVSPPGRRASGEDQVAFAREAVKRIAAENPRATLSEGLGERAWWAWVITGCACALALAISLGAILAGAALSALLPLPASAAAGLAACWVNASAGASRTVTRDEMLAALDPPQDKVSAAQRRRGDVTPTQASSRSP